MASAETTIQGGRGNLFLRRWDPDGEPRFVVLLAHGYGEHAGRYDYVAEALNGAGAVVYAADHHGHGRSDGERALIDDADALVADLGRVDALAREANPGLPVVLIGHSMGGMIATRFIQTQGADLAAAVISAPIVGGNPAILALAEMDPMPEMPLDAAALSRDPAVAEAYLADPLIYHGGFARDTLQTFGRSVEQVAADPGYGDLPVLWIHGELDPLAPLEPTREAMVHLRGPATEEKIYEGALHEIFNETNRDEVIADVLAFIERSLPQD